MMSTTTDSFPAPTQPSALTQEERNALILRLYPKLHLMAAAYHRRCRCFVDTDDLLNGAVLALISAIDHFDPSLGTSLWTFAYSRILGSFGDAYRSLSGQPRSAARAANRINVAVFQLQGRLCRNPTHHEIASELDLDIPTFYKLYDHLISYAVHSLDAPVILDDPTLSEAGLGGKNHHPVIASQQAQPSPYASALNSELRTKITRALHCLDPEHQEVFELHYRQQLSVRTICKRLGKCNRTIARLLEESLSQLSASVNPSRPSPRRTTHPAPSNRAPALYPQLAPVFALA